MTKDQVAIEISHKTGIEKPEVVMIIESLMDSIKDNMVKNKNVYLRGFGSFIVKKRAKKTGRNILKNISVIIPEHFVPVFKPSRKFLNKINKIK